MRLTAPFIQLPLLFDALKLAEELSRVPQSLWRPHPEGHAGNSALPLVALAGDDGNDGVAGPMRATQALSLLPSFHALMARLNVPVGRSRLMRLEGNAEATLHVDTNYYWQQRVRIHVPIVTHPDVSFICGDQSLHMKAGECWIFDTWRKHNVLNPRPTERIHLVIDTVGSDSFWHMINTTTAGATATPQRVNLGSDPINHASLQWEATNFPVVMSPAEQQKLFQWWRSDLLHPAQTQLSHALAFAAQIDQFLQRWAQLFATFAEDASGHGFYRTALNELNAVLATNEGQLLLANGSDAAFIARQWLSTPALNPQLAALYSTTRMAITDTTIIDTPTFANEIRFNKNDDHKNRSATGATTSALIAAPHRKTRFQRPVFIVAAPRSGSTLLFETLLKSPDFYTVGGEAHAYFERFDALKPSKNGWHSNRVGADAAQDELIELLESVLLTNLRNRDGKLVPASNAAFRFLEKTPKNALRIPFLNAVFSDALFIYLYREPRDNVSSIIDAWRSGGFVTYPDLPEWKLADEALPWSLALVPGWRELIDQPLSHVAATQWARVNETIISDLAAIDRDRWTSVAYHEFLANPQQEIERLCAFANVRWDQSLDGNALPLSRHTLTAPDAQKWRNNERALRDALPLTGDVAARARTLIDSEFIADINEGSSVEAAHTERASATTVAHGSTPAPGSTPASVAPSSGPLKSSAPASAEHPFSSSFTSNLPDLLQQIKSSIAISTYQANQLVFVRARGGQLNTHFVTFPRPMGMIHGNGKLFLGTQREVVELRNMPEVGKKRADQPDACYLPRVTHMSGEIDIHELGIGKDELWAVNTRFSCLSTIDYDHSFVPRWRPSFITGLSPEDRCHLNGLAMVKQKPKFVSALGECDHARGWRDNKAFGGILMDVDTKQVLIRGLSMPHSPRWYRDQLWFLESGYGALCTLDLKTRQKKTIATMPGFTRGLDFFGPLAFIGLSQVRETASFSNIPITQMDIERTSGVYVINIETGQTVAFLRFNQSVQEVFSVSVLVGQQWPDVLESGDEQTGSAYALPDAALKEIRVAPPSPNLIGKEISNA
jgi:uncharacterized protein (TIGR03032 family)